MTKAPRKRVARGTGEQRIIDAAIDFFAEEGFRAPTRDLAKRMGVSQALIYRYFRSKQALIDKVFDTVMYRRKDTGQITRLLATDSSLEARLIEFYREHMAERSRQGTRLFLRAGLDEQELAANYTFSLNDRILFPVIVALRKEASLPPPEKKPVMRAERELVMTLHGALSHMGFRKFVYDSPLPDDLSELVTFNVWCFLEGAVSTIKKLHAKPPGGHLGVELGDAPDSPIE